LDAQQLYATALLNIFSVAANRKTK